MTTSATSRENRKHYKGESGDALEAAEEGVGVETCRRANCDRLDDCSRVFTASRIYQSENLLAYFDLLPAAFIEYGLPLQIYVDFHSLFFTHTPQALTQLGRALHFYGVTFRYAPTPQAKEFVSYCTLSVRSKTAPGLAATVGGV